MKMANSFTLQSFWRLASALNEFMNLLLQAKRGWNPESITAPSLEKQVNVDRVAPQGGPSLCTVCRLCRVFLQTCNNVQRTLILGPCHNKENSPFLFGGSPTRLRSFTGRI